MKGLLAILAAVADYVLTGAVTSAPRACNRCGHLATRLTRDQQDALGRLEKPMCRRRGCGGELWSTSPWATDRLITELNDDAPGSHPGAPDSPTTTEGQRNR